MNRNQSGEESRTRTDENAPAYPRRGPGTKRHLHYRDSGSPYYEIRRSDYHAEDVESHKRNETTRSAPRRPTSNTPSQKLTTAGGHKNVHKSTKTADLRAEWMRDGATIPSKSQEHLDKYKRLPFKRVSQNRQCVESITDRLLRLKEHKKKKTKNQ